MGVNDKSVVKSEIITHKNISVLENIPVMKISASYIRERIKEGKSVAYLLTEKVEKYVDENNIDRPNDFVVKSVANKSALKIHIITSIDKKSDLADIASQNNIKFDELLVEVETIVNSGTKINLNYYIDEMLEEEEQEEIFEYFMESDTDSLEKAYEEFEEEYEEEELRLMRIKFMSEVAN